MLKQIVHQKNNKYKLKTPAILIAAACIVYIYYREKIWDLKHDTIIPSQVKPLKINVFIFLLQIIKLYFH